MIKTKKLPDILKEISLADIIRIDYALEGNWNNTVVTIWSRDKGFIGYPEENLMHNTLKPSIELYFNKLWLGIHCYNRINNKNIFDKEYADIIIKYIEDNI